MKLHKTAASLLLFSLVFCCWPLNQTAAAPNIETIVPNSYEEQEFKDNKEFLREEGIRRTEKLPEKQKALTFEHRSTNVNKELAGTLFADPSKPRKTVALIAGQYGLFSEESNVIISPQESSRDSAGSPLSLKMLYIVLLVAAVVILFIFLVPKAVKGIK
jgi:type VII secretion protein EssA